MLSRLLLAATFFTLLSLPGKSSQAQEEPAPATPAINSEPLLLGQPRSTYYERRRDLLKRLQATEPSPPGQQNPPRVLVVLRGADDPDIETRFRQSNDFAYLTGVNIPYATLVLDTKTSQDTLYLPPPNPLGGFFVEAQPAPGDDTAQAFGFDRVESSAQLLADLFAAIADPMTPGLRPTPVSVYLRHPEPAATPQGPEALLAHLLHLGAPHTRFADLKPHLAAMRTVKSPSELALIQQAIDITAKGLDRVAASIRPELHEYAIRGLLEGAFIEAGALRPGFPSIIASGPNATIPHYFGTSRQIQAGDLVVVDIGAEYQLYTADITRTFPATGQFTPRQRELYQLVLDAQKAAETAMKPGKYRLGEMTAFTRDFFNKSPLRALDSKGREQHMDRFFVHGLGHGLGMDVHDVGGLTAPVGVGEVFTIEPGLYIPSEGIGIRIEDDYLMTEEGPKKLSNAIPSTPDEVECWLRANQLNSTPPRLPSS